MKKIWKTRRSLSSSPSTFSVLSSPLVYAFANVLMRCVVTMVSNVSDSSESWPCMSLHAHMLEHLQTPHGADGTQACTYTAYNHKHLERYALSKPVHVCVCARAYLCTCTQRECVQKCKAVYVRTKQLQLPAREEKLPVASLQTAVGQPRYQPISYVEAEWRK